MKSLLSIARYTFVQQFRNRLYLVVLFFGALLMGVSLLFGALAAEQEVRVIFDLGLLLTELFGIVAVLFGAVTLVLEEMESKTIYLLLTRPLPRGFYIVGRYLGLVVSVVISLLLMGVIHVTLLGIKGWSFDPHYLAALPFIYLKVCVVGALAVFFSLFSSSAVASVVFTLFFSLLGHFGSELTFLARKSESVLSVLLVKTIIVIMPNFQFLNYRDVWHIPGSPPLSLWVWGGAYAVLYAAACLSLSIALFSRKEF